MKKQTKVLLAAALFTLGASFSSMAALKSGTWDLREDGWHYVNKNGSDESEVWATSYNKEYWINEDGVLGSCEWVDGKKDGEFHYVQSDGSKTVNAWKYILPYGVNEDDEDAEPAWFWFDNKGKMVSNKSVTIGEETYYFDADGKMLTGWIYVDKKNNEVREAAENDAISKIVFAEESGARMGEGWLESYAWGVDEDEADEDELHWYYITEDGEVQTGKKTGVGKDKLTYFFNKETGVMMTGWVAKENKVYTGSNGVTKDTRELYFCDEESGYAKTKSWRKLGTPETINADDSDDVKTRWYYFDENGKAFLPKATDTNAVAVSLKSGALDYAAAQGYKSKEIGKVKYYFNNKGELLTGLQKIGDEIFNLVDGEKYTGIKNIKDDQGDVYEFCFAKKDDKTFSKGAAVTGNVDKHLYVNGQLQTAGEDNYKLVQIDSHCFIVDENGIVQTSRKDSYFLKVDGEYKTVKIKALDKTAKGYFLNSFSKKDLVEVK